VLADVRQGEFNDCPFGGVAEDEANIIDFSSFTCNLRQVNAKTMLFSGLLGRNQPLFSFLHANFVVCQSNFSILQAIFFR
jgi:hypothetical protein